MTFRDFEINGRTYGAELLWQSLGDAKRAKETAKVEGKTLSRNHVALLTYGNNEAMGGFVDSTEMSSSKVYSLALAMAEALEEKTWASIFRLEEECWHYVAFRDGKLVLGSDIVRKTRAEVLEVYSDEVEADGEFDVLYSHEGVVTGCVAMAIEDILAKKPSSKTRIRPVRLQIKVVPILITLAVIGASYGGYLYWNKLETEKMIKLEMARQQAIEAEKARLAAQTAPNMWETLPKPSSQIVGCVAAISPYMVSDAGWALNNVECNREKAILTYQRTDGNVSWIKENMPGAEIDPKGDSVALSVPMTTIQMGKVEATGYREAKFTLVNLFQSIGVTSNIIEPQGTPSADPSIPVSGPTSAVFTVRLSAIPDDLGNYLDAIPALTLTSLKWNPSNSIWEITGEIHGKP